MSVRRGARTGDRAELDLAQLLHRYLRVFSGTDPARAFQYILLVTVARTEGAAVRGPRPRPDSGPAGRSWTRPTPAPVLLCVCARVWGAVLAGPPTM